MLDRLLPKQQVSIASRSSLSEISREAGNVSEERVHLITESLSSVKEVEDDAVFRRYALGMPGPYGCGRVHTSSRGTKGRTGH